MSIGTPSGDPGGQEGQERVPVTTMAEAIKRAVAIMPPEIQQRQLIGPMWEEICAIPNVPVDHFVRTHRNPMIAKVFLASYLVNIVVQNLMMELVFRQKVDPVTRDLEPLDDRETKEVEAVAKRILAFVKEELHVPWQIVDGTPKVAI